MIKTVPTTIYTNSIPQHHICGREWRERRKPLIAKKRRRQKMAKSRTLPFFDYKMK
jgi:hypothetical protein